MQPSCVGATVRLRDLVSAHVYNGAPATVLRFIPSRGRFEVRAEIGGGAPAKVLAAKHANFDIVALPAGGLVCIVGADGIDDGSIAVVLHGDCDGDSFQLELQDAECPWWGRAAGGNSDDDQVTSLPAQCLRLVETAAPPQAVQSEMTLAPRPQDMMGLMANSKTPGYMSTPVLHEGETRVVENRPSAITQVTHEGVLGYTGGEQQIFWKDTGENCSSELPRAVTAPEGMVLFSPYPDAGKPKRQIAVRPQDLVSAQHPIYYEIERMKQDSDLAGFCLAFEAEIQIRTTWFQGVVRPRVQASEAKCSLANVFKVSEQIRSTGVPVLFPPTGFSPSTQQSCVFVSLC